MTLNKYSKRYLIIFFLLFVGAIVALFVLRPGPTHSPDVKPSASSTRPTTSSLPAANMPSTSPATTKSSLTHAPKTFSVRVTTAVSAGNHTVASVLRMLRVKKDVRHFD